MNEGQQTELPCETRSPVFNSTQHALRVEWFHLEPHHRRFHGTVGGGGVVGGAGSSSQPIYTVDFGVPKEKGKSPPGGAKTNLLQVRVPLIDGCFDWIEISPCSYLVSGLSELSYSSRSYSSYSSYSVAVLSASRVRCHCYVQNITKETRVSVLTGLHKEKRSTTSNDENMLF